MRLIKTVPATTATLAVAFLSGCAGEPGANAALDTDDQKASYAIGVNMGRSLSPAGDRLEFDAFMRGLNDALEERDPALTDQEMVTVLQAFSTEIQQAQQEELRAQAETNLAEGTSWLQENSERDGVVTTATGLQYEVVEEGDGDAPGADDEVSIHYRGTLIDGTEFDSSYQRGQPSQFTVGGVIAGFAEGLQLMPVGSTYKLYIPAHLGYGPQGSPPDVPPNAVLIFEVEMLDIVE